ncbi:hypothetical protein HPB48_009901 [Haemaphysalis longicornis]|uniref:Uncharacterized protein n=1 Tax=Haemaphysalis longicornis TaxID=44386 RepID=A0A9J6GMQ7_HAELO|nr:hypothetical protein HPB48_009901 [Haemaphysalis longicornis]
MEDKKLRSRLLRGKDLSISKAIDFCKAAQLAANQNNVWDNEQTAKACIVEKRARSESQKTPPQRCSYCNMFHHAGRVQHRKTHAQAAVSRIIVTFFCTAKKMNEVDVEAQKKCEDYAQDFQIVAIPNQWCSQKSGSPLEN